MKVNAVNDSRNNVRFGNLYVTMSKENLSTKVRGVVKSFINESYDEVRRNARKIFEELKTELNLKPGDKIYSFYDLDKVDVFVLAAGKGSRFASMCEAIQKQTGEQNNKITIPIKTDKGDFHLLDSTLSLGVPFAKGNKAAEIIEVDTPMASFHDVYDHYKEKPYKDFVILSGDCIYGKGADLKSFMKFIISSANNPKTHLSVLCGTMTPERAAGRAAVATVGKEFNSVSGTYPLQKLKEKPSLDYAMANTYDGDLVYASAGGFYSSAEVLAKMMKKLEQNPDFIKKNDKEIHDYATYADKIVEHSQELFGKPSNETSSIFPLKFSDVGTGMSFIRLLAKIQQGDKHSIQNLPKDKQEALVNALKARLVIDDVPVLDIGGQYGNNMSKYNGELAYDADSGKNIRIIA